MINLELQQLGCTLADALDLHRVGEHRHDVMITIREVSVSIERIRVRVGQTVAPMDGARDCLVLAKAIDVCCRCGELTRWKQGVQSVPSAVLRSLVEALVFCREREGGKPQWNTHALGTLAIDIDFASE